MAVFWAVPQACVTAELSTSIPGLGGQVDWVHVALGRVPGIANSWLMAFWQLVDLPMGPIVLASYCAGLFPGLGPWGLYAVKVAIVAVYFVLNVLGIDALAISAAIMSALVFAPFIALPIVAAALHVPMDWTVFVSSSSLPTEWSFTIPVAISTLIWSYNGFWALGTIASDVDGMPRQQSVARPGEPLARLDGSKDASASAAGTPAGPRRFIAGTLLSVALCTVGFTYPMIVGTAIAPDATDWQAGFFVTLGSRVTSAMGDCLFAAAALNSFVTFNSCFGAYSRGIQASALRGDIPIPYLGLRVTRWRTPVPALALSGVVSCVLLLGFGFNTLIVLDSSVSLALAVLLYASFVRLRYSQPELPRPYAVLRGVIDGTAGAWVAVAPLALLIVVALAVLFFQAFWGPLACVGLVAVSFAAAWFVDRRSALGARCGACSFGSHALRSAGHDSDFDVAFDSALEEAAQRPLMRDVRTGSAYPTPAYSSLNRSLQAAS